MVVFLIGLVCPLLPALLISGVCWTYYIPIYLSFVQPSFHEIYYSLWSCNWDHLSSSSVYNISVSIFCSATLVVMNCIRLCLPWNVLISPLIKKNSFAGYNTLGRQLLTFRPWNILFYAVLASRVANQKNTVPVFVGNLAFSPYNFECCFLLCISWHTGYIVGGALSGQMYMGFLMPPVWMSISRFVGFSAIITE